MNNAELMDHEALKRYCKTLEASIINAVRQRDTCHQQITDIRSWFNKHGHTVVMGETILEKLDNLQAIIDGLKELVLNLKNSQDTAELCDEVMNPLNYIQFKEGQDAS